MTEHFARRPADREDRDSIAAQCMHRPCDIDAAAARIVARWRASQLVRRDDSSVEVAMSSAGFIVNVTIVPIGIRLLRRKRAGSRCLLRLMYHGHGTQQACRV